MNRFIYSEAGDIRHLPKTPVTSRFVSPWDTSGWYSVLPDFNAGKKVYSNCGLCVKDCPAELVGADYIMTFNSNADGFDDKQEVDFYVERDALVSVCIDTRIGEMPDFTKDFSQKEDALVLDDGTRYLVFEKKYFDGDEVHIPGISGECNHFIVAIRPADSNAPEAEIIQIPPVKATGAYEKRQYQSYVNEVFNDADALSRFDISGDVLLEKREDERDMYAKISGTGSISGKVDAKYKTVCSALVTPMTDSGSYVVCAFLDERGESICGVFIDGGEIKAVSNRSGRRLTKVNYGEEYSIKVIFDSENSSYDVWINSRAAACKMKAVGTISEFGFFAKDGILLVDNVKVYDDTYVFVSDENGKTLAPKKLTASKNAILKRTDIPFKSRPSIVLSSGDFSDAYATYALPEITGVGSAEIKIKATDRGIAKLSLMGKDGEICSAAFYMNNLYVSNENVWERVYAGLTDFMYYPCKNSILVKFTFDTENGTYSLWVDGALRAKGMKMTNAASVCGIGFETSEKTKLFIEKIRVYDDSDLCRGLIHKGKVFNVKDAPYNAKGDGETLDTKAIQSALDDAAYTGGTVLIDGGTFLCGELFLRSDETVFVSPTATVLGTNDHGEYPLMEPRTSLCAHRQLGRGLFYGENIKNITVTGGGMLDGNGLYRFKMNDPLSDRRAEDARPDIVYISYSSNIDIENINFKSSAFWTVVPLSSGNVILRYINLDCMNTPNRDGIDPVDCHDITVCDCCIMAGDDGLCFKSSDPVGCYNIDVHDMMIQSLASGIKFGTDTYYSLKDGKFSDCTVKNVNRCGVSLETVDGAAVENVTFERIDMTDVGAPVYITVGARNRLPRGIDVVRRSYIDGVTFRDLRFEDAYPFSYTKDIREVIACGQSADQKISNVTFENCYFELAGGFDKIPGEPKPIDAKYPEYDRHGLSAGHAFTVRFAHNFKIKNCKVKLKASDVRPMAAYFDTDKGGKR